MSTRRHWLKLAAAASFAATASAKPKKKPFAQPLGVQLYTVRSVLPQDPEGTLKAIAQLGYREVEITEAGRDKLVPVIKAVGLKPVSAHIGAGPILKDEPMDRAFAELKSYGVQYAVLAFIDPKDRGDAAFYRAFAQKLNRTGEACAKAGLQFAYHNHAFEFEGKEGERPWDAFTATDPKLVQFELDVFWLSVAGQDPAQMIRKFNGRVPLVHLKDKGWGTPNQFNEKVRPEAFKEAGTGVIDFESVLRACAVAGVKHYFVEQDQTPGDPIASLRLSYNKLRSIKL